MWEDSNAWNAYADSNSDMDYGGYNPYMGDSSPVSSWDWQPQESGFQSQQYHYDQPSQMDYSSPSQMRQIDQYDWSPKYTPGAVWNPSVTQITSGNPSVEEMYNRVGGMQGATYYRGLPGGVNNPQLRDVEHYAAANEVANNRFMMANPMIRVTGATLPVVYSGAKYLAQNAPGWLQPYLPGYLTNASYPSWQEVWSGMKPFLR